jgi:hypothetical protein
VETAGAETTDIGVDDIAGILSEAMLEDTGPASTLPRFTTAEAIGVWLAEAECNTKAALLPTLLTATLETVEEASPRMLGTLRLVARLIRGAGEFTTVAPAADDGILFAEATALPAALGVLAPAAADCVVIARV